MSDQSTQDLANLEPLGAGPTRTREIEHLKSHGRFALMIDGREVAVVDYRRLPGKWNIVHTYTEPASRGYGVASDLIREVAYGRLTKRERLIRHLGIAEFLDRKFREADADDGTVDTVTRHFVEAARLDRDLGRAHQERAVVAHAVREDIARCVGLPTRIGLGPTRTLSKVANALGSGHV